MTIINFLLFIICCFCTVFCVYRGCLKDRDWVWFTLAAWNGVAAFANWSAFIKGIS